VLAGTDLGSLSTGTAPRLQLIDALNVHVDLPSQLAAMKSPCRKVGRMTETHSHRATTSAKPMRASRPYTERHALF